MLRTHFFLFYIILLIYLGAGVLYAVMTPNWQAPDEPAHYNYIRHFATEKNFPELVVGCYDQVYLSQLTSRRFPAELSISNICYEFHQPPLYYLLATPLFILGDGSLIGLRLLSVVLGGGVIVLAFFIVRAAIPEKVAVAYGTMALVAFVPMHVAILASVNNDVLAELILAALLFLLTRRLLSTPVVSLKHDIWLGLLLGLGLVTKTTVYIILPLVAVALWFESKTPAGRDLELSGQKNVLLDKTGLLKRPWNPVKWGNYLIHDLTQTNWAPLLKHVAIIYGLAFIIAAPWFIRNALVYGNFDILGLRRHDEIVVGQLRTVDFLAEVGGTTYVSNFVGTTFRSFWGQFGWMAVPMDGRTYLLLTLLTLIATGGVIALGVTALSSSAPSPPLLPAQGHVLSLMALVIFFVVAAYGWYNLTFVQFQGRYLFPGLIPIALFFSLGLGEALSRRWIWWLISGLSLALAWVVISILNDGLDKWALLIIGLALSLAAGRLFIAHHWSTLTPWLLAICYLSLSLLTLASPFWFVLPYL
jgi:hypothetical protein